MGANFLVENKKSGSKIKAGVSDIFWVLIR